MEIRYKRTYSPAKGKRYTAGEINGMLGYALELAEPRAKLKEGRLAPGEICLLIFALTPEEYALKDENPRALDKLAEQLGKAVPADRLMGWRILNLKGENVQRAVQLRTGESIDGGAFAARLREAASQAQVQAGPIDALLVQARSAQKAGSAKDAPEAAKQEWIAARKALGAALLELEEAWVALDALSGSRWPAVGFDGRVEIFTTEARAHRVQAQVEKVNAGMGVWSLKKLNRDELHVLLRTCAGDGLELLRIDNGFASVDLTLRDFMETGQKANAPLRSMMLREIQYGLRFNRCKETQAPEANRRGALESMLTLRGFAWREIGNGSLWALCAGGDRNKCVVLGKDGGEKLLAAFTTEENARAFARKLNPGLWAVEMKFDELARCSEKADGLLIDYGTIGYRLAREDYDKLLDLRGRPPVVVRVQQDAAPQAAAPQPEQSASLPDPDDFDLPARSSVPAAKDVPQAESAPETPERKGFFKKLFGK